MRLRFTALSLAAISLYSGDAARGDDVRRQALLASPPYTVEDLGPLMWGATRTKSLVFNSQGATHYVQLYGRQALWKDPINLWHVDLSTGASRLVSGPLGAPPYTAAAVHPNGKLYFASGDPGYLFSYDPGSGAGEIVHQLADKTGQTLILGDDGKLYVGGAVKGYVESYDPDSGQWGNYGIMDDPGPPYYRYAYTLGADGRYLYVGIGQDPWYLVIYDTQTNQQTVLWKGDCKILMVYKGVQGGWYADRTTGNGSKAYYQLLNGAPVQIQKLPALLPWDMRAGVLTEVSRAPEVFQVEFDLADSMPDTTSQGVAGLRYRPVGETQWTSVSSPSIPMDPLPVKRFYAWDAARMLGFTGTYGPVYSYDPGSNTATAYGRSLYSDYDAVWNGQKWTIVGYPAVTVWFDPGLPWTLTSSVPNVSDPNVNPHKLAGGFGKYHYYAVKGNDGRIYVAANHERDSTGGELGWHDPVANQSGSIRDPLLNYSPRGLVEAQSGSKIVYSSGSLDNTDGKLFILDTATRQIVAQWTPVAGQVQTGPIVEAEAGMVLGVIPGTTTFTVYKIDIKTGAVSYARQYPGRAFGSMASYDRRLVVGPDGCVWLYVDDTVCRIQTDTGNLEQVLTSASAGGLVFQGGDLYIYGGTSLRKVAGLLTVPAKPDFSLTATPGSQTVDAGASASYTLAVTALDGFSGTVDVSASVSPEEPTIKMSLNPASLDGSGESTLEVTTEASTNPGTYTITVTATSRDGPSHSATVLLVVNTPGLASPASHVPATPSHPVRSPLGSRAGH